MPEDRLLELLQQRARLDAQLIDERAARRLVCGKGLRLPSGAVEREHELPTQPFAERLPMNLLLVRHGYPPAVIYKRDRTQYLNALRRADRGDSGPLAEMVARAVTDAIYRFLLPGLAGPHRLVPLRSLADSQLSPNALAVAAKRGRLRAIRKTDQWYSTRQWVEQYKESRYRREPGAQGR